jgi:ATP adenylyltransferase
VNEETSDCPFCQISHERVVAENDQAIAIHDGFPVTDGHTLIIPRRHVADYFDLHQSEREAVELLAHECRQKLMEADASINGFNLGANSGESAGQTIFHVHLHLIPRRTGDIEDPRGGVRGVIPNKRTY